jgi:hypothetical protein
MRSSFFMVGLGVCLGVALGACEDTIPANPSQDMAFYGDLAGGPDGGEVDLAAPIEFEDFVLMLINAQTADTTIPTTTEDKVFIDSMDPTKFAPLF